MSVSSSIKTFLIVSKNRIIIFVQYKYIFYNFYCNLVIILIINIIINKIVLFDTIYYAEEQQQGGEVKEEKEQGSFVRRHGETIKIALCVVGLIGVIVIVYCITSGIDDGSNLSNDIVNKLEQELHNSVQPMDINVNNNIINISEAAPVVAQAITVVTPIVTNVILPILTTNEETTTNDFVEGNEDIELVTSEFYELYKTNTEKCNDIFEKSPITEGGQK
jgi:hypothetical protein